MLAVYSGTMLAIHSGVTSKMANFPPEWVANFSAESVANLTPESTANMVRNTQQTHQSIAAHSHGPKPSSSCSGDSRKDAASKTLAPLHKSS